MRSVKSAAIGLALAAALVLASCATTNKLGMYNFEGARMASEMRTPPPPRLDIRYDVILDHDNPLYSSLSVLTNIAKAAQGQKAEQAMRDALASVDVPGIILVESSAACAAALGTAAEERRSQADYLLILSIHEWGIEADSPGSPVALRVRVEAQIVDRRTDDTAWSRTISVAQPATPDVFGLGGVVGNMVTATALSNMNAAELEGGFADLAREAAAEIARRLEKDLGRARFGY